jgi:DNA primase
MGALERLANQVGVPFELDGSKGDGNRKKRLLELHEQTAAWFQQLLQQDDAGEAARHYLASRELKDETPEDFRLGYAPDAFDAFLRFARERGFTDAELEASGLVGVRETPKNGEALYDRFRNRLIFPICDEQARVIGFSGRAIPPAEVKAKYLNSPETLLFKKSRVLYGIHKARKPMAERRRALLCEGQLDVIRCHEAGLTEAVAAQGTAVTEEHGRILKRYADEVVLVLDADTAGIKAALRSAEVLLACGLSVSVASLPEGKDPDDLVREEGYSKLRDVVGQSDPFVVFQVRTLVQQEGEITETSRLRVARTVMRTLAVVPEAVHREELLQQAAGALGMRAEALRQDLVPVQKNLAGTRAPKPPPPRPVPPVPRTPRTDQHQLPTREKTWLELLITYPDQIGIARKMVRPEHVVHPECQAILEAVYTLSDPTPESLLDLARNHAHGERIFSLNADNRVNFSQELGTPEDAVRELAVILRREALSRQRKALQEQVREASAEEREQLEPDIWRLAMLEGQLKECFQLRDWTKAGTLLELLDLQ